MGTQHYHFLSILISYPNYSFFIETITTQFWQCNGMKCAYTCSTQ